MNNIIFGIPVKRVAVRDTLQYPAFIMQEAPTEKGKAYKMQFSDPAIDMMGLDLKQKNAVAIASVSDSTFFVVVTPELRSRINTKDICGVYADGSLSNKRLYQHLAKIFELDVTIKNTFTLERASVSDNAPGTQPLAMFKLGRAASLDAGQVSAAQVETPEPVSERPLVDPEPMAESGQPQPEATGTAPDGSEF